MTKTTAFLVGAVAGVAAYTIIRTPAFKKACAGVVAKGMELKDDAAAFAQSLKEDAQDIAAEKKYSASKA